MKTPVRMAISGVFVCAFLSFAPGAASAMPVANNVGLAPATEEAHAVRVCNRWGRCWWSYAGHYHGRYAYGWRRPVYGWRPGWGWRGRYGYGWRGHGWRHGWRRW